MVTVTTVPQPLIAVWHGELFSCLLSVLL